MNSVTGSVSVGSRSAPGPADGAHCAIDVRVFTHRSHGFAADVSLSTLTASFVADDRRSLLIWGSGTSGAQLRDRAGLDGLADALTDDPRAALAAMRGGWALAFVDHASNSALVAVDRVCRVTACVAARADGIDFGLNARDVMSGTEPAVRLQALYDYFYNHVVSTPQTVYHGVERLLPGEYLRVRDGAVSRVAYWSPAYEPPARRESFKNARSTMKALVESAVRRELGTAKTGAFLSGGTYSSTIAGMLGRVSGGPADTYSIGFDAPGFDEMSYARIAARHFGTRHHEYYVTPDDLVASIPEVAGALDQPFGNSSVLPAYYCARLAASDGVTRLLGGDGGDEIFGGNTRYVRQQVFNAYRHVPQRVDRGIIEALLIEPDVTRRLPLLRKLRSYVEQARVPMPGRMQTYNLVGRLGADTIFTPGFLAQVDLGAPLRAEAQWYGQCADASTLNRMLHYDWKITLADNDLPKVVSACTLAGVEVGFPMLDEPLVEFANALPPAWKVRGARLRPFFKSALADFLPREIIRKRKHGFGLPFGWWLAGNQRLQDLAFGSLESFAARGIVRREFIDELLGSRLRQHAGYFGEFVWLILMLEQWLAAHAPDLRCR